MIDIVFQKVIEPREPFEGSEIGGCHQGNYEDTPYLKHLKIRSTAGECLSMQAIPNHDGSQDNDTGRNADTLR